MLAAFVLGLCLPPLGACGDRSAPEAKVSVGEGEGDARDDASMAPDAGALKADAGRTLAPKLPKADREIELPFGASASLLLEMAASVGQLDVVFNVDTTASMDEEIDLLQRELLTLIIPALRERVDDVAMGVSRFEDFPVRPFGGAVTDYEDRPFTLLSAITQDQGAIARAVRSLDDPLGFGGDLPEAGGEALYQLATGEGYKSGGQTYVAPFAKARGALGDIGGAGFRKFALPVVVHITDAPMHEASDYIPAFEGVRGRAGAVEALQAIGARVIGIDTGGPDSSARPDLRTLAEQTQAFISDEGKGSCPTGQDGEDVDADSEGRCWLVFSTNEKGSGLSELAVDGIISLIDGLRFSRVNATATLDPNGLVQGIKAVALKQPDDRQAPVRTDRLPADAPDGIDETFENVLARSRLGFEVRFRNDQIKPLRERQSFRVLIQVLGDGLVVEEHLIRVVVPAVDGPVDAGAAPTPDAGPEPIVDGGAEHSSDGAIKSPPDGALDAGI